MASVALGGLTTAAAGLYAFTDIAAVIAGLGLTFSGVAEAIAIAVAAIAVISAAVYTLYKAWQVNFGGIREYTLEVWKAIKSAISTAMTEINSLVGDIGGKIVSWWRDNYPLIQQTVKNVSDTIKSYIQAFLSVVQTFWQNHGESIKNYVSTAWNFIKSTIGRVSRNVWHFSRL